MLKQIHPNLMKSYINYGSKNKLDFKKLFTSLSVEMGGDGQKITKEQLNSYIKKAENGSIKIGKTKLRALKMLQKNWDEIAKDKDSITLSDLKDYSSLLAMTAIDDYKEEDKKDKKDDEKQKENKIKDYIKELAEKTNKKELTKEDFSKELKSLIAESSDENDNSEEIDTVVNILAAFDQLSNGKVSITKDSINLSKELEA